MLDRELGVVLKFGIKSKNYLSNMATKCALFYKMAEPVLRGENKVTVVGAGAVGVACAFSLLSKVSQSVDFSFTIKKTQTFVQRFLFLP